MDNSEVQLQLKSPEALGSKAAVALAVALAKVALRQLDASPEGAVVRASGTAPPFANPSTLADASGQRDELSKLTRGSQAQAQTPELAGATEGLPAAALKRLPDEALLNIFTLADIATRARGRAACKRFNDAISFGLCAGPCERRLTPALLAAAEPGISQALRAGRALAALHTFHDSVPPPPDGDDCGFEARSAQIREIFGSSALPAAGATLSFKRPRGCACDFCPGIARVDVPLGSGRVVMEVSTATFNLAALEVLLPSCVLTKQVPAAAEEEEEDRPLLLSVSATWSGLRLGPATKHQPQGAAPALAVWRDLLLLHRALGCGFAKAYGLTIGGVDPRLVRVGLTAAVLGTLMEGGGAGSESDDDSDAGTDAFTDTESEGSDYDGTDTDSEFEDFDE